MTRQTMKAAAGRMVHALFVRRPQAQVRPLPAAAGAGSKALRRKWLHVAAYAVFGALMILVLWFALARPVQVLPRIRPMPVFVLQDQNERWLSDDELRGRIALVSFAYSRCADDCAPLLKQVRSLHEQLRADGRLGAQVLFLTISFDSAYDTPATLRPFAARLAAESPSWRVLRGEAAEIKDLVGGGFGVYYTPQSAASASAPFTYDQRVVLIDDQGLIRAEYDGARFDEARVLRDIDLIQREANSSGVTRTVYEAAHLFFCYPP